MLLVRHKHCAVRTFIGVYVQPSEYTYILVSTDAPPWLHIHHDECTYTPMSTHAASVHIHPSVYTYTLMTTITPKRVRAHIHPIECTCTLVSTSPHTLQCVHIHPNDYEFTYIHPNDYRYIPVSTHTP